jgi:hypothetical protein
MEGDGMSEAVPLLPPDWTRYLRHLEGCAIFSKTMRCDCGMLRAEGRLMDEVGQLREALRLYTHCRHACETCFCTKEAKANLFDSERMRRP